jgi:hypothetical protein
VLPVLPVLFRLFVQSKTIAAARVHADRGIAGSMEGHAAMDMSVPGEGPLWRRLALARNRPKSLANRKR